MIRDAPNLNALWAALLVEELIRNGIDTFCITSGSRSTPLTVAAARHPRARQVVHFDERGAAFYALGYGKAALRPAALICTSGTAAANYWPAVAEAAMARVPMLLLTADRPPELTDAGANQAIDQVKLYGSYARWHVALPCPSEEVPVESVLTAVDQAVYRSRWAVPGPVHMNCPFREPLAPTESYRDYAATLRPIRSWLDGSAPYTRYSIPQRVLDSEAESDLMGLINESGEKLVLVGPLRNIAETQAAAQLARALGWPVFADIASGLRSDRGTPAAIPCFDLLLRTEPVKARWRPDTVLHIGGAMTSKTLFDHLGAHPPRRYIRFLDHPGRDDPSHSTTYHVEADLIPLCRRLAALVKAPGNAEVLPWLRDLSARAGKAVDGVLAQRQGLSEPAVARLVFTMIDGTSALFLGNSMPIRDMDLLAGQGGGPAAVFANRGASGIDGTVATAAGLAHALGRPVTAVLGDLALLHDLNSMALLHRTTHPVTVVAINNHGGGIFHFLPIAEYADVFEKYFATPHTFSFEQTAASFGLGYSRTETIEQFQSACHEAWASGRSTIIEALTDRREHVELHRMIEASVAQAVESAGAS
jgi:2-succinyl-5-enolpyruvyl-6-hydroxy-3-cyclohexene-1-carboxylate synthase